MKLANTCSALGVAAMLGGAMVMFEPASVEAQQGVQATAPKPANSQPAPANSQPDPANSQPRTTGTPQRVQPEVVPNRPATPPTPAGQTQPGTVPNPTLPTAIGPNGQPVVVPNGTNGRGTLRYERPFAFQSPNAEVRFSESSRRLLAMESRMNMSNQALLKRLGEVRNLAPEKQNAALADIVQQILLDQAAMHKYLVQARTGWTGELEALPAELPEDQIPTTTPVDAPTGAAPGSPPTTAVPVNPPR